MTDLDILHAAILDAPKDDLARLAYADELEARAEPGDIEWARVIRFQIRTQAERPSERLGTEDTARDFVGTRLRCRGFIESVCCSVSEWRKHGPRLVREHPILRVGFWNKCPCHDRGGTRCWELQAGRGATFERLPGWLWKHLVRTNGFANVRDARRELSHAALAWAKVGKSERAAR